MESQKLSDVYQLAAEMTQCVLNNSMSTCFCSLKERNASAPVLKMY